MNLTLLFCELKENCYVNAIIDYRRKENEFSLHVYCLEKDNDMKKERNRLLHLYYKYGLSYNLCYGQPNWELPREKRIISTKPIYFSMHIFSFKKKKVDSFFFIALIFILLI